MKKKKCLNILQPSKYQNSCQCSDIFTMLFLYTIVSYIIYVQLLILCILHLIWWIFYINLICYLLIIKWNGRHIKNTKGGGILWQFCSTKKFITAAQATVFDGIGWFFLLGLFLIGLPLFHGFAEAADPPQNWKLTIFGHFLFCGGGESLK